MSKEEKHLLPKELLLNRFRYSLGRNKIFYFKYLISSELI